MFLTFCGLIMVTYTSVIGGGFVAGYWLQGNLVKQLRLRLYCRLAQMMTE